MKFGFFVCIANLCVRSGQAASSSGAKFVEEGVQILRRLQDAKQKLDEAKQEMAEAEAALRAAEKEDDDGDGDDYEEKGEEGAPRCECHGWRSAGRPG